MKAFAFLALLLGAVTASAETPVPATVEFMFDVAAPKGIKTVASGDTSYLKEALQSGGELSNGWWHVASTAAFGQGELRFEVDRKKLAGDLALVLHADWQKDTDVAVQLYDAQGRAMALDLFGEMRRNAKTVGTDTFVVPLDRYPEATSIVVRRLSGEVRIVGAALFPVLSEISSKAENEQALAAQLGVMLSPHHWIFARTGAEGAAANQDALGTLHVSPPPPKAAAIGAYALRGPNYPVYRPITKGPLQPPKVSSSMTSFDILTAAFRMLASSRNHPEVKASWMTSGAVAHQLVDVHENLGFMSVAMSSAEKEKFYRSSGFPITEFHYAHDAIEVLVHADNPVRSLTVPQLDAIFGAELRAGAPAVISDWSAVGGSAGTIRFLGGGPNSGTTRMFQQSILKGGEFRSNLERSDVVTPDGIEADVANDPTAIGFVTLRPRRNGVRALAVAPNSGERAAQVSAEDVYSGRYPLQRFLYGYVTAPNLNAGGAYERELVNLLLSDVGQTLVARVGELPLTAKEVIAQRSKLDLPQ